MSNPGGEALVHALVREVARRTVEHVARGYDGTAQMHAERDWLAAEVLGAFIAKAAYHPDDSAMAAVLRALR